VRPDDRIRAKTARLLLCLDRPLGDPLIDQVRLIPALHRHLLRCLLVAIAVASTAAGAHAQRFKFDRFTADTGLPSSFIVQIEQDDEGNVWFVTIDGLSRFDGRSFSNFGTTSGMTDQRLSTMERTPDGRILLGSASGLSIWDGHAVRNLTEEDGLGRGTVWAVASDAQGRAWVGTQAGGLSVVDGDAIRTYDTRDGLPSNFVYALRVDSKNRLWIGTRGAGLAMAEIRADGTPDVRQTWSTGDGLTSTVIRAILEEPDGAMLVGTRGGGVYRIDDAGSLTRVAPQLADADVYSISAGSGGNVYFGLLGEGARICGAPAYERCLTLDSSIGLGSDSVTSVLEDREGALWIGTISGAYHLSGHAFVSYGRAEGLSSDLAFSITTTGAGALWIASLEGVTRLEIDARGAPRSATTLTVRDGLPTDEVWQALEDRSGRIWIATADGLCLRAGSGCRTFGTEHGLPSRQILSLLEDREGRIWATTRNGVTRLRADVRPDARVVSDFNAFEGFELHSIAEAADGSIWVAGTDIVARYKEGAWASWRPGPELGTRAVNNVLATSDGSVWLGSNNDGLARFDPDLVGPGQGVVRLFGRESGLTSLAIKSLVEARDGMIWAGTPGGLFELDPAKAGTPEFVAGHFTIDDGLVSQEVVSPGAFARCANGDLWFGFAGAITRYRKMPGMNGSNAAGPPKVAIRTIHAGSAAIFAAPFTTMAPVDEIERRDVVIAPLGERDLSISYTAAVFRGRRGLAYQVRLEGYDTQWSLPTSASAKEYTRLPPGSYTFFVRARKGEGEWGETAKAQIRIPPMTRETVWFRLLVAFVAILLLVALHHARLLSIRRRNAELATLVAEHTRSLEERTNDLEETNRELEHANVELDTVNRLLIDADRAKSLFLARMSHELRTPLNSIIGFTDVMMDASRNMSPERRATFLRNVRHSATILLGLINDILDISKIEAGRMEVHVDAVAIIPIVEEVAETMRVSAESKGTIIRVECAATLGTVMVDAIKVRQILQNLISNAIKYSPDGATITVAARRAGFDEASLGIEAFELAVSDDGRGIPADQIMTIFEEYRQAREDSRRGLGTGLGLAIVRKFAELQGGRVSVESEVGRGSTFRVWLPVDASHWDSER
jgi:signal transduction histidine kinase/ligand-binding sensor domain-containing protein